MNIILLRHGYNNQDKLTFFGKKQAKLVANQLKMFNIQSVVCSPQQRCVQTAQIVCKKLHLSYVINDNLKERFQLGHKPQNKQEQDWWDNYLNINYASSQFETCKDYLIRNHKVFDEIKNTNKNTLIVAHSATSYALLNYIFAHEQNITYSKIGYANFVCFEL